VSVGRRVLPAVLAIVAAVADRHGAHGLAFYALLGAVPFAATSGIVSFGLYLEHREDAVVAFQALLWGFVLALLVISCAARSPAVATHQLPPLGWSALVAALAVFALKACLGVMPFMRQLALARPVKP
jgi:hypothetical protein